MAITFVKFGLFLSFFTLFANCNKNIEAPGTSSVYSTLYKRLGDTNTSKFDVFPISHYYYMINHGPIKTNTRPNQPQRSSQPSPHQIQGICYFPSMDIKKLQSNTTYKLHIIKDKEPSLNYIQNRGSPRPPGIPDQDSSNMPMPMKSHLTISTTKKPNNTSTSSESEEVIDLYLGTVSSQRRRCPGGQKFQGGKCRRQFSG